MISCKSHIIKIFAIIVCLSANVVQAQIWPVSGMQGDGTSANPWIIQSAEELHALALFVNEHPANAESTKDRHYRIVNDLDLTEFLSGDPQGWLPIGRCEDVLGNTRYAFKGYLHGGGHVISGFRINRYSATENKPENFFIGLFGVIEQAVIDSLGIEVAEKDSVKGGNFTGLLVGYAYGGNRISQCYVTGKVSGQVHVGGMVGLLSGSSIENSYAVADVYGESEYTGGLVGEIYYGGEVKYAYSAGDVSGYSGAGGLIGYLRFKTAVVQNVVASGTSVEGTYKTAKIIGENRDAVLEIANSYSSSDMQKQGEAGYYDGIGRIPQVLRSHDFYTSSANWTGDAWRFPEIWVHTPDNYPVLSWQGLVYSHRVVAKAEEHGQISPSGDSIVIHGENITYSITPDEGYHIDSVIINGKYRGTMFNYTFFNVSGDSTIRATFAYTKASYTPKPPVAINTNDYGATLSEWILSEDNLGVWNWEDGTIIPSFSNSGYRAIFTLNNPELYVLTPLSDKANVAVTVTLPITEPTVNISGIPAQRINENTFTTELECNIDAVDITVNAGPYDTVKIQNSNQNTYRWKLEHYGDQDLLFSITSISGHKQIYNIVLNKKIPFEEIIRMRWNNTLTVINNPNNNGGFTFTSFKWFINDEFAGFNQAWSAGINGEYINPSDVFRVELTAQGIDGILRSCESCVTLKNTTISAYPSPVQQGEILYVETGIEAEFLNQASIEVYNLEGNLQESIPVKNRIETGLSPFINPSKTASADSKIVSRIPIRMSYPKGVYILILRSQNGLHKEMKIVVN